MDDQNKTGRGKLDHWDILASTLGAMPAPEGEEAAVDATVVSPAEDGVSPPPSVGETGLGQGDLLVARETAAASGGEALSAMSEEIVSESPQPSPGSPGQDFLASLPQSTFVPPRPDRQKTPQDWARLASQLGIEVPAEAFEPVEATAATTLEPTPRPSIVVTTLETGPWPAEKASPKPPAEESGPVRQRRKRRRKSGGAVGRSFGESRPPHQSEEAKGAGEAALAAEELDDLPMLPEERGETWGLAESPSAASADSASVAEAGSQPASPTRAKRRRRKKKKSAPRTPDTPEAALAQARERVESIEDRAFDADAHLAESADSDSADRAKSGEEEEPDDDKGGGIHRSIPTWEEAVGIIISANLEARARNPDRRASHSSRGRNR